MRSTPSQSGTAQLRWHKQTILGGGDVPPDERGDCVRACITSILGLPIDAVPNIHGEGWWDRLQEAVGKLGYAVALLDVRFEPPPVYWIASVPSLNLGPEPDGQEALHSVVCRGYELVHEPGIGGRLYDGASWTKVWNDDKVAEGWVLVPLDPVEVAA